MPGTWGNNLKISIFGESHGTAIGVVLDGLLPGEPVNLEEAAGEMLRRAPGRDDFSTARKESDQVEILSGLYEGKTTGTPLCGIIYNGDARSKDYDTKLRPGHADLTALLKYGGHADMRGGGHFSGRLTAPLVFAGAVAKQILARRGVAVCGRITQIAAVKDTAVPASLAEYREASLREFSVFAQKAAEEMKAEILRAKEEKDSVGGSIEAVAFGVPAGLGAPLFGAMESVVASMLFAVPAVKGVEFGEGFAFCGMRGSAANDAIVLQGGNFATLTNHNGGILGGITNGMPLIVRAAIKPTPSIGKEQQTVDTATMQPATIAVQGRHDPCIVQRAVPVVEAGLALAILDCMLQNHGG